MSHRRPRLHPAALALAIGAAAAMVAGCGSSSSSSSSSGTGGGETITLYSAQHEQTTSAMIAAFTAQTGIKVKVDRNSEDVLTAQIGQEGSRSPADVFYSENSNWLQQLDDKGLLAPVTATTLAAVPSRDNAADGRWVGVSARYSLLIYNPSKITAAALPTTVLGLADPKYKGKFELAPSETDFWPIVSSVARSAGQPAAVAWLRGLRSNAGSGAAVPSAETLVSDVSQGTTSFALINHYYFFRARSEVGQGTLHAKVSFFAPGDPGYVEDVSGAAVLRSSAHQAAAQRFVAFLTSQAGQSVLAQGASFEYPLHPGVAPNPALPAQASLHPTAFTPANLGTGLDAKNLLQQVGLL